MTLKKILMAMALVSSAFLVTGRAEVRLDVDNAAGANLEKADQCLTVRPGPDWTCVGDGWYPPGMPLPTTNRPAAPQPVAATAACTSVRPGPDWNCVSGGWLPPGMPVPAGAAVAAPSAAPVAAQPSAECPSLQPGPDWSCVGGGWWPPGMAVPAPATRSDGATSQTGLIIPDPGTAAAAASTPSYSGGGRLRMATWNIHFGQGDTWGQVQDLANSGADVVVLQEAQTWDEYMPTTYPERLRQVTGQRWFSVWSEAANPACSGGCQGNLVLSRFPILDSQTVWVSGTAATRALIDVGGVQINVFGIHLEYYDTNKRSSQLLQFMDWSRQFAGPRLVGGDFNSWWGEWWIRQMESEYSDTWQDVTGSIENGYTLNGTVRFDYLFRAFQDNWRVTPVGTWVQPTPRSDHSMVVADYVVR